MRVAAIDHRAAANGIRVGQTLGDAKSLHPDAVVHEQDSNADRAIIEALAIWADQFTPIVQIEDEQTLLLDVTGCDRLFHGEEQLVTRVCEGMQRKGFHVSAALADTNGAAWAWARTAHPDAINEPFDDAGFCRSGDRYSMIIIPAGQTIPALAMLPVGALRIDPKVTRELAYVGVHHVKDLLHLPRASLAGRFGDDVLKRIDQATGELPEPLVPYQPPRALAETVRLTAPTDRRDQLEHMIEEVLAIFCRQLDQQGKGVRCIHLTFNCPDCDQSTEGRNRDASVTESISLSKVTRSRSHLQKLVRVLVDQLQFPGKFDAVTMWTQELEQLDDTQRSLFDHREQSEESMADLLDRLAVRLGKNAVVMPQPVSEYQPEHAFRYAPVNHAREAKTAKEKPRNDEPRHANAIRPLRLLQRPREIGVTVIAEPSLTLQVVQPDVEHQTSDHDRALDTVGAPQQLRFHGQTHDITLVVGPERIETGWWRGPHTRRDYYRVRTNNGQKLWIFQNLDTERWFLHGWF